MWRKQRREEAAGTMTDANVNTADGPVRDLPSADPHTDSVPPSQGEEDIVTQDIKVASQSEAHFWDVSDASDQPHRASSFFAALSLFGWVLGSFLMGVLL